MRHSIATVSLSGMLLEKLQAASAAGMQGVEIFENDLLSFSGSPRDVRRVAGDLGLTIDLFQPFRDFEGVSKSQLARNMDRAERKFDLMQELGAPQMLVCSNVNPDASGDLSLVADQLSLLAERAARRDLLIGFEALAWGARINRFAQAWAAVQRAAHPNLGLILDSFHTLAACDDPRPISKLPGEKIFFVQLADAPRIQLDKLSYSRHYRCFPGQGELDLVGFLRAVLAAGYRGPLSLEIFNDDFRAAPARATAVDAKRSLLWLEEQVRLSWATNETPSAANLGVDLFIAAPPSPSGWSFIEFAVDIAAAQRLAAFLVSLGAVRIGHQRRTTIDIYALGQIRLLLNSEPDSFARAYFDQHGTSVCALAVITEDPGAALTRAVALGCTSMSDHRFGPDELAIPAVCGCDGSLLYFCRSEQDGVLGIQTDHDLTATSLGGARIDHIVQALPGGQVDSWALFYRAVLGLLPVRSADMHDPYGLIHSRELESLDKSVRYSLIVSERDNTQVSRSISRFGGAGVNQIAIAVPDLMAKVDSLKKLGAPLISVPENYYDDIEARFGLDDAFVEALRRNGVLYDRSGQGEFLHIYTAPFEDRFEFEFVERRGGYELYGNANVQMRLVALAERRMRASSIEDREILN